MRLCRGRQTHIGIDEMVDALPRPKTLPHDGRAVRMQRSLVDCVHTASACGAAVHSMDGTLKRPLQKWPFRSIAHAHTLAHAPHTAAD